VEKPPIGSTTLETKTARTTLPHICDLLFLAVSSSSVRVGLYSFAVLAEAGFTSSSYQPLWQSARFLVRIAAIRLTDVSHPHLGHRDQKFPDTLGKKLPPTVPALSFCTAGRITGRVPGWSFRNLSHAQVGGITTVRLSMGFHGGAPWPILPFAVKRRLSHILKYSERPTAVSCNKPTPHYQATDLLSTRWLDRPVRYQTYMVAGGWGA
jgi:hypothetical protein